MMMMMMLFDAFFVTTGLQVCPGNQLEVIDHSILCDGNRNCQDGSDEGSVCGKLSISISKD